MAGCGWGIWGRRQSPNAPAICSLHHFFDMSGKRRTRTRPKDRATTQLGPGARPRDEHLAHRRPTTPKGVGNPSVRPIFLTEFFRQFYLSFTKLQPFPHWEQRAYVLSPSPRPSKQARELKARGKAEQWKIKATWGGGAQEQRREKKTAFFHPAQNR